MDEAGGQRTQELATLSKDSTGIPWDHGLNKTRIYGNETRSRLHINFSLILRCRRKINDTLTVYFIC